MVQPFFFFFLKKKIFPKFEFFGGKVEKKKVSVMKACKVFA